MSQAMEKTGTGSLVGADWVARAKAAAPAVAESADETAKGRQVAPKALDALHEQGLFKMLLPAYLGGGEASPVDYMKVLEIIGAADGSTAWCLGQGLGCSQAAGFVSRDVATEIFGDPRGVLAWGPTNATAKAVAVKDGYRATGRWRFASGSHNATWIGGHCPVFEEDGSPKLDKGGRQAQRTMLFPIGEVDLKDTWHVIGLEGTGSDDYEVKDKFVPAKYTTWRNSAPDRSHDGPLYNIPLLTLYGMGFAGIALGLGRAMLDAFVDLAETKVGAGSSAPLRENAVIQSQVCQSEAKLSSSRAFLIEMLEEYWDVACRNEAPSMDLRARLRASITWSMLQSREVCSFAYNASGTNAIFKSGPFERRFRDIHTLSQQGQAHLSNFESAGRAMMGLEPGHRL